MNLEEFIEINSLEGNGFIIMAFDVAEITCHRLYSLDIVMMPIKIYDWSFDEEDMIVLYH